MEGVADVGNVSDAFDRALVLLEGAGAERSAGVDLDRQISFAVLGDFLRDVFVELDDAMCRRKEGRKLQLFCKGSWPRSVHRE